MKKTMKNLKNLVMLLIITVATINTCIAATAPLLETITSLKANPENGKHVYLTCSLCHSPQGWGTSDGYYPQLSGQHPNVIAKQLIDIQSGHRDVPTMIPFSDSLFARGQQNAADVIGYISSLPMNPKNGQGKGDNLANGKMLYQKDCQSCHGDNGEGVNHKAYPLLQGQHYPYLLRQITWIKDGTRKNGNTEMMKTISTYSDQEMQAVADYISRMKPPETKLAQSSDWKNPDFPSGFVSAPWLRHEK